MRTERYRKISSYLKEEYGERVQRISVDAGFTCPNLDGTISSEGCIYCRNQAFSHSDIREDNLIMQIKKGIERNRSRYGAKKYILYFQSYTNTYASTDVLKQRFDIAYDYPEIVILSVGTRPDCIDKEKAKLLSSYRERFTVWVEVGLQSSHDRTLEMINRGHNYSDFTNAVEILHSYGIDIFVHIILGLPGESTDDMISTAKSISLLPVRGLKIHPLHIVRGTRMEKMYLDGEYTPLSRAEYIDLLISFLENLRPDIIIDRIGADVQKNLLIAPGWISDKSSLIREFEEELSGRDTWQGRKYGQTPA